MTEARGQWREPSPAEVAAVKSDIRRNQKPPDARPEEGDLRLYGPDEEMQVRRDGEWKPWHFWAGREFLSGDLP